MVIDYHLYIVRDSSICGGEPVVKGTRDTVRTILARLAEGRCAWNGLKGLLKAFLVKPTNPSLNPRRPSKK